ncbi:hypothetical protein F5884DRAFT_407489 [Xylogone sp. PMI_703]|nr:hypothetical protein F5884DRAFT_407489 [Xylogone sp. PMI_703]
MSASGVFGPAPPGVDLSENRNASLRAAVITLMVIGTVFVVLRFIARSWQKGLSIEIDDIFCAIGLLFAHGTAICSLVSLKYGGAKHLWVLTGEEFTTIWQILFAYVMIYAVAVTFTKLSIVLFYRRIFGMTWHLWICVFLAVSYMVTVIITINVACRPLPYFWTQYTTPGAKGECIDVPLFFFANGIWAMLVDVCILVVPIPIINKLNMPPRQKFVVILILLLGSFVCIASIVRVTTIHTLIKSADLTWAMSAVFIWSCCEPFIGIVCACLPTLAPFFRRFWTTVRTTGNSGSDNTPIPGAGSKNAHSKVKSLDLATTSNVGSTVRESFRPGKSRKEWSRLQDGSNTRLRGDDEVELTNEISGPGGTHGSKDGSGSYAMTDIYVKKDVDVSWNSTRVGSSPASSTDRV